MNPVQKIKLNIDERTAQALVDVLCHCYNLDGQSVVELLQRIDGIVTSRAVGEHTFVCGWGGTTLVAIKTKEFTPATRN